MMALKKPMNRIILTLMIDLTIFDFHVCNLHHYFNKHVCLCVHPSVRPCFRNNFFYRLHRLGITPLTSWLDS